jgi:hypothetical protein
MCVSQREGVQDDDDEDDDDNDKEYSVYFEVDTFTALTDDGLTMTAAG